MIVWEESQRGIFQSLWLLSMWLNLVQLFFCRVWRARDVQTGTIYALKEVKLFGEQEGFPITCLREIDILLSIRHVNIVNVREVVVGSSMDKVYMVMEYCPHDLKDILSHMKQPYSQSEVKSLMLQILAGVNHLHENWVRIHATRQMGTEHARSRATKFPFNCAPPHSTPFRPTLPVSFLSYCSL